MARRVLAQAYKKITSNFEAKQNNLFSLRPSRQNSPNFIRMTCDRKANVIYVRILPRKKKHILEHYPGTVYRQSRRRSLLSSNLSLISSCSCFGIFSEGIFTANSVHYYFAELTGRRGYTHGYLVPTLNWAQVEEKLRVNRKK